MSGGGRMFELSVGDGNPEITATSFTNTYNWGDLSGNPRRMVEHYFDAHLYFANWGTRRLMLRLPAQSFDLATVKPYCVSDVLDARATKEHVILDFHSESEGDDEP